MWFTRAEHIIVHGPHSERSEIVSHNRRAIMPNVPLDNDSALSIGVDSAWGWGAVEARSPNN